MLTAGDRVETGIPREAGQFNGFPEAFNGRIRSGMLGAWP